MKMFLLLFFSLISCTPKRDNNSMVIVEQGNFTVGGDVIQNSGTFNSKAFNNFMPITEGQSYHGDHAYVSYQIPQHARRFPVVFLHGAGQSSQSWQTTPDGRDGFNNIFLKNNFSVYLVDQPRRDKAGRSTVITTIQPLADEQMWYEIWRIGLWPNAFDGVQFPTDKESLNQFFRQMTPNTGAFAYHRSNRHIARPSCLDG